MDDSFQFIIESPQHSQGHKKRPRLVTSCDNCRLKKIKCLQPSPETKCEACKAAKIPCRFRDRERYFAERSRAIAGPGISQGYPSELLGDPNSVMDPFSGASSSSSPALSSHSNPRSTSHSPKASGLVSAEGEPSGRYQSYPPDSRRSRASPGHSNSSSVSSFHSSRTDQTLGYDYLGPGSAHLLQHPHSRHPSQSQDSRPVPLFDPEHPERPHPSLMQHFIQLFFEHLGGEFTFLTYEETMAELWEQRLPPLLSNCIAFMSSRYSNIPELTARGLHNVADAYTENAKRILSSVAHIPSMETLHGVILLSWAEYKNNKMADFRIYCQTAMRMAIDLGLSDQSAIQLQPSESERIRRRSTWASILQLHMTVSSLR